MIDRRRFLGFASVLLVPGVAQAHGPSRQKVIEKIEINASPEKVWAVIGNFGDMGWLPIVEKTEATNGNTPDKALRKLTLKGGGLVEESLSKYSATDHSYAYRIEKVDVKVLPVTNYSSQISVTAGEGGKAIVEWRGAFYRGDPLGDPPPELNDDAALAAVGGLYKLGLEALKKKLEQGS